MKRPLKSRICRLLACISPLTTGEIVEALDGNKTTVQALLYVLKCDGCVRSAPITERQRQRQYGHRTGWELA